MQLKYDMLRDHHLHLDGIKLFFIISQKRWADEEVDSEGCSAIAEYLYSFCSNTAEHAFKLTCTRPVGISYWAM